MGISSWLYLSSLKNELELLHTDLMWAMEMVIEFYSDLFHEETPLQPMQARDRFSSFVLSVNSEHCRLSVYTLLHAQTDIVS